MFEGQTRIELRRLLFSSRTHCKRDPRNEVGSGRSLQSERLASLEWSTFVRGTRSSNTTCARVFKVLQDTLTL